MPSARLELAPLAVPVVESGRLRSYRLRELWPLVLLLTGAALLRLDGIRYGLPFALLNVDERNVVPRAWGMTHGAGPNPDWFEYPTLLMYLLAPLQALQPEPSYLSARLVVASLGVLGVAAAWWLGRRAYGPGAGWVAGAATAVATTHVAYSHMAVTDVPLTLAVTVALGLALARRLEWAGIVVGLAASVKYPGALLLVPLVLAGWGRWRRLGVSLVAAALAFAATSPFVVSHPFQAADDARRVQRLAQAGWLGFEHDHATPIAYLDRLWEGLGPVLLLAAGGLVLALVQRRRADLVLGGFLLAEVAYLLTLNAHFDRYVLPLVPALAAFAGRVRPLVPLALALCVVPLAWSLGRNAELRKPDTRARAEAWVQRALPAGTRIAAEPSSPPLVRFRVTKLALPGPGRSFDSRRDLARLRADGVRYVLVNGEVADRVLAARERYGREARFYDDLEAEAQPVFRVSPGAALAGPWVTIYRL